MEISERLTELIKTVDLKTTSDMTDLAAFFEIYDDVITRQGQSTQDHSPQLLDLLISTLRNLDQETQEIVQRTEAHTARLIGVIDNLSASFPDPKTGNQSFVRFLWSLHRRSDLFAEQTLLIGYEGYIDQMESLSWLFQLEAEGQPVYPISYLLNDSILGDFDPDSEDDLLYLIASLQLFNRLRNIPENTRETVLEISREYQLKILEMLCNNGELLFGEFKKQNMEKNRIMAVRCKDQILIRTTDLSHPAPDGKKYSPYFNEINKDKTPIAKYFTYQIGTNCKTCSLDQFLLKATPQKRLEIILDCIKNKIYNVFMDDSVIYDANSNQFIGWVNPVVSADKAIISRKSTVSQGGGTAESQFFSILDQHTDYSFRPAVLIENGIDMLTLDYIIAFYETVSKSLGIPASSFLPDALNHWLQPDNPKKDTFAQNAICEAFFAHVLKGRYSISTAITNYAAFIKNPYTSFTEICPQTRLIFPYSFYLPFGTSEGLLKALLESRGVSVSDGVQVNVSCEKKGIWSIDGIPGKFKFLDSSTHEPSVPNKLTAKCSGFLDKACSTVYVLAAPEDKAVLNAFTELEHYAASFLITQDNRKQYDAFLKIDKLKEIIYNIGIPAEITKLFWPESVLDKPTLDQRSPLLLFKIIHHINAYSITPDKLDAWQKLIFKYHLLDPCDSSHEMYKTFAADINGLEACDNCLIISKQSYADKSTLGAILHDSKSRHWADCAFDPGAINNHIVKQKGIYYISTRDKQMYKIERIIFLTDNIISGSSTVQMLRYHFNGQKYIQLVKKRAFIKLEQGKTVQEIMKANSPRIELRTVFWFGTLGNCTVSPPEEDFYPVDVPTTEEETVRIHVKACKTYAQTTYLYTPDAFALAATIYGKENIQPPLDKDEKRHLVFRFNNMPAFSVFPETVLNVKLPEGLFHRRAEST